MNDQPWFNKKQSLLLKAAFSENPSYWEEWAGLYNKEDLDEQTRAILPHVLEHSSLNELQKKLLDPYRFYIQHVWLKNLHRFSSFGKILSNLINNGIDACLLKGGAMLLCYYKNTGMRPIMQDFDLLVKTSDIPRVIELLKSQEFWPMRCFSKRGDHYEHDLLYHPENIIPNQYAITYTNGFLKIDLHWRISPLLPSFTFEFLRPHMQDAVIHEHKTHVLNPLYHLFHTCIHGMSQTPSDAPIHWITDIFYLLNKQKRHYSPEALTQMFCKHEAEVYLQKLSQLVHEFSPSLSHLFPNDFPNSTPISKRLLQKNLFCSSPLIKRFCYYSLLRREFLRVNGLRTGTYSFFRNYFGPYTIKDTILFFIKKFYKAIRS